MQRLARVLLEVQSRDADRDRPAIRRFDRSLIPPVASGLSNCEIWYPLGSRDRSNSCARKCLSHVLRNPVPARPPPPAGRPRALGAGNAPGSAETDRAHVRVRSIAIRRGATAEHLAPRCGCTCTSSPITVSHVHQRTSAVASIAGSSAIAADSIVAFIESARHQLAADRQAAITPDRQRHRREPGERRRTDEDVCEIHRHGSAVFSPALNAGVGVVGVNNRSTPAAKTWSKSSTISWRVACARL